ncbi:NYN domain-containing protein [Clostridium saccharobutylicum]|uniref:Putative RNA-binding protein n=1 Tax=Clostridium saccharobutylicum DSM 13864 TaxID=1345695 RepID=U5MNG9_CLOSA|nr:NYN domain-containing protein [Clostridium saccharobutylicum]AGX41236.1 putative RNA-binding protein [Clostridium saccharobutylicum DSM 13864]AQR88522.1 YacP-like NYN domain protein [Clostridium saccharobutylicum]AQR98420.1 YacP-like NYN domain protein [Clostridium saccharobutylicum]AQS08131.1 YacP-like NYN domain protein [Clostridium saccharobutylicum]AQS12410.1 YacP-like NYN domain protein [Clostridium saccharobutylicum]
MKTIFVDGYNVVNSWPNLKQDKGVSFEGSRQLLIDILHNYGVFKECKIVLVFDAHKVAGSIEKEEQINKNISVVFTKSGETADSYIEKKVNELGRKHEIVVVTSDNLEQQTIFQRGATRMASIEFYNEILKVEKSIKSRAEKNENKQRNSISDNIDDNTARLLEEIRRSK